MAEETKPQPEVVETPIAEAAAPAQQAPQPEAPKKSKKKLIILGLFLLSAGLLTALVAVAYSGAELPLISDKLALNLQKTYANLPFVPKTARHILLQGVDKAIEVQNLTYSASLKAGTADISSSGSAIVDKDDADKSKVDLNLSAQNSGSDFPFELAADLRVVDNILYLKVDTLTSPLLTAYLGDFDPTPLLKKWWKIDPSELGTTPITATTDVFTEDMQKKALDIMLDPDVIGAITLKGQEKIGEEMCYHLLIVPNADVLITFVEAGQKEPLTSEEKADIKDGFKQIEKFDVDVWSGKTTKILRKIKVVLKMETPEAAGTDEFAAALGLEDNVELTLEFELPKINSALTITAPEDAHSIEELNQFFMQQYQPKVPSALGVQTKRLFENIKRSTGR